MGGCCWQEVVENCKSRNSERHRWWRRFALPAHMCAQPISGGIGNLSLRQTCYSFSPLFPNTYFCLEAVFWVAETAGLREKANLFEAHCCSTGIFLGKFCDLFLAQEAWFPAPSTFSLEPQNFRDNGPNVSFMGCSI